MYVSFVCVCFKVAKMLLKVYVYSAVEQLKEFCNYGVFYCHV